MPPDLLSFLGVALPHSEEEGTTGVVQAVFQQQLQPLQSLLPEQGKGRKRTKRDLVPGPLYCPVDKPASGMFLHLNHLNVRHLPLAGRLRHCLNWVLISQDP